MGTPDMTNTTLVRQLPAGRPAALTALHGITGHAALLLLCGILAAAALPHALAIPEFWVGAGASLVAGEALLCVRHTQPRIDDREIDMILAVTTLASVVWVVRQWPPPGDLTIATIAWMLCMVTCLLTLSGTRAAMWLWPAALPALAWLLPDGMRLIALLIACGLCLATVTLILLRRGWSPRDQLATIPPKRLALVASVLLIVALTARIGVTS